MAHRTDSHGQHLLDALTCRNFQLPAPAPHRRPGALSVAGQPCGEAVRTYADDDPASEELAATRQAHRRWNAYAELTP